MALYVYGKADIPDPLRFLYRFSFPDEKCLSVGLMSARLMSVRLLPGNSSEIIVLRISTLYS